MMIRIESGFDSCGSYTLAEIKDGIVRTRMNPQKWVMVSVFAKSQEAFARV